MILRCCWRGLSPALLATPGRVNSSRSCSCQLSNSINKKVDEPHRGCTYGPKGLCRLSQGLSNYENNIHKQRGIVKQHKFRHFRKQKSDLQIASRCTSINRNVRKGRSPLTWVGLYFMGCPVHSVPVQPHKTAPQRRPKGSQSLMRIVSPRKCQL